MKNEVADGIEMGDYIYDIYSWSAIHYSLILGNAVQAGRNLPAAAVICLESKKD